MANVIQITLNGTDATGPAFQSAAANARAMSVHVKAAGQSFQALAGFANTVGIPALANVSSTMGDATLHVATFGKELAKSKIGVAALAATVATVFYQAGKGIGSLFGTQGEFEDKATKFSEALNDVNQQIIAAQESGKGFNSELDKVNAKITEIQNSVEAKAAFGLPSWAPGGKDGMKQEEVDALVEKYRQLRDILADKEAAKNQQAASELLGQLILKKYEFANSELAAFEAEKQRHAEQLKQINELTVAEGVKNNLIEAEAAAHEARLTAIKQEQSDARIRIAQQAAQREAQIRQAVFASTAGLFGALSGLAAAQGKKGFQLAQAFRYAEAIVNTAAGVTRALADYPWPFSTVVAGIIAATGAVQLATIASAKPPGQAHAGLGYVPEDATYMLKAGERVLAPQQNQDFERFIDQDGGGSGRMTHVTVNLDGRPILDVVSAGSRDGQLEIDARSVRPR